MVFEKRKIQTETLSEYLFSVRSNLGLSCEEVSRKTGISMKFLNAIESGNLKTLPADVYVMGFLNQLAAMYAIDNKELIEQFKREKGIERNILKQEDRINNSGYKKVINKIIITPRLITITFGLVFVFLTIAYIIWQVWSINRTPRLEISSPHNNEIVTKASVEVSGKTDPGMSVTVNGQNIFVDSEGIFSTQLGLSQGPAEIIINSSNRFGKSISKTINISTNTEGLTQTGNLNIMLNFTDKVTLSFFIDSQPKQTMDFNKGDSKTFTANEKITFETSDAGATLLNLNGQDLGPMGKNKESLSDVTFYRQPEYVK